MPTKVPRKTLTAAMQLSEDLNIEIEALQAIHDSAMTVTTDTAADHRRQSSRSQVELQLQLSPQTGGDESSVYVLVTLGISVPSGYPQQPPICSLVTAKGLGDARAAQLLSVLQQAAEEAAGEMALVQLAAAAQDAIDAANSPEGDCPICMFPLADGGSGDSSSGGGSGEAQKLPCFHCMHRQCFLRWWRWGQAAEAARAATLRKEQGPAAERAVAAAGLVPDAQGRYRLACPACRSEVVPEALLPPPPPLSASASASAATAASEAAQRDAACSGADTAHGAGGNQAVLDSRQVQLPPQQMTVLRAQQIERRAAFERQRQQGGIIEDTGWGQSIVAAQQAPSQPPVPPQQTARKRSAARKLAVATPQRQAGARERRPAAAAAPGTANCNHASATIAGSAATGRGPGPEARAGSGRRQQRS